VKSIEELRTAEQFINIISQMYEQLAFFPNHINITHLFSEAQKFAESRIGIPALNDSLQDKFQFVLEYLSSMYNNFFSIRYLSDLFTEQSTSSITEWNIQELIRGNTILLSKV
jgi:hypothetical protein